MVIILPEMLKSSSKFKMIPFILNNFHETWLVTNLVHLPYLHKSRPAKFHENNLN